MSDSRPSDRDISRLLQLAGARPALPDGATDRVRAAVHAEWRGVLSARRRRRRLGWLSLAAVLVVTASVVRPREPAPEPAPSGPVATVERVTGSGLVAAGSRLAPGAVLATGTWLETAGSGRAALRLVTGASVRLDHATRLQVVSPDALRLERGAVYVDSADDAAKLRIETREGSVSDVGTQFQVRIASDAVQVHVREGRVVVLGRDGQHDAGAGTRLDVSEGRVRRSAIAGHGAEWAWVEATAPEWDIDGRTLHAFLEWASRETGLRVEFEDEALERSSHRARLHGSSRGLTPSQAIEAVLPASGLVTRRQSGTLRVERVRP